jgi:hypothetical protein
VCFIVGEDSKMLEPTSAVYLALPILRILSFISPGTPSWQRVSRDRDCFLRVYDLNIGQNEEVKISASTHTDDELQDRFANLSAPEPGSIRIYIEEGCRSQEAFLNHLESIESEASSGSNLFGCGSRGGFSGMFSQWSALAEQKWWAVVSHELIVPKDTSAKKLFGVIGGSDAFLTGLMQLKRSVRLVEARDGHLTGRSWQLIGEQQLTIFD